jgi:SWI/SNF-related matrix-associated actin-dependent regulator 1 of chromatin subfamily A
MDEAHFVKNNAALRTKAVKLLAKGIPHLLALTGTPIENRPVEIFNAIKLVNPNVVPSFWEFAKRFCGMKHNGYGWDFSGSSNTKELHDLLVNTIMIRRLKKDVLPELPDKVYSYVPMKLNNEKEYGLAEADFISFVRNTRGEDAAEKASNAESFARIEGLKQLAVKGKLPQVISWINDFLEVDGKLVVYAHHKFVIDELTKTFGVKCLKIDGSVPVDKRQGIVDKFQNDLAIRLMIISEAGGVGITLTAASNIAILELPWTPGSLSQIIDRLHRIGQKFSVNIHFLLAESTIEEKIASMLDKKMQIVTSVLDGTDAEQASMLKEIMNAYK